MGAERREASMVEVGMLAIGLARGRMLVPVMDAP